MNYEEKLIRNNELLATNNSPSTPENITCKKISCKPKLHKKNILQHFCPPKKYPASKKKPPLPPIRYQMVCP